MMTLSTLTRRAQKYILILRDYREAHELYGSQSPVLVAIKREQDILWCGMDDKDKEDLEKFQAAMMGIY